MNFATTDLLDAHEASLASGQLQVASPLLHSYGGRTRCHGPITTLKLFEDNSLVRSMLGQPGQGRVLVVDGGASLRCALLGDQLAQLAVDNGWSGVIVHGCIRDSKAIAAMDLGVWALATHPLKSVKRNVGEIDLPVVFAGVRFQPGAWLYADEDGLIVSEVALQAE